MSALGQKQTFALHQPMPALGQKRTRSYLLRRCTFTGASSHFSWEIAKRRARGGATKNYLSLGVTFAANQHVVSDNHLALDRRCRLAHSDDNIRDVRSGNRSSLCPA